ncbi:MAG: hypothetical protein COY58_03630 [Gammaproteobacteria bacterium CG_4_10_14_0_8_um_filter_38_16]|nr:MAG: hypothetical protein COY58_03630 [Gammaproteobacteria bacterium CG_4_10_14_0_8_um_filter_38_16]PJA03673.1 MAG: hypothetical protein COX72_04015 [Gammaproteobacteria bacterium CG_4_10_14_0_2_um_filter_38_22]PJB11339.1 MAG: hypothetical protein CO120_00820 [Gammaproteobacteria bacterium CG_4_9_14_3_um_filter_38_9]
MTQQTHPSILAVIRESECIGCTKCIQACPFDAIIGAQNLMHTVLSDACNGCKLCIAPCPVDCIDLIELPERSADAKRALAQQSRARFKKHKIRIEKEKNHEQIKIKSIDARKNDIAEMLKRRNKQP